MKMIVKIDSREIDLQQECQKIGLSYHVERLDSGDIQYWNETQCQIWIERKTWTDYDASFHDGRYQFQKQKWEQFHQMHPHAVSIILLEGPPNPFFTSSQMTRILHSIIHRTISTHWHLLTSESLQQTAHILHHIDEYIEKNPPQISPVTNENTGTLPHNQPPVRTLRKGGSSRDGWIGMLQAVPGVSATVAMTIMEQSWATSPLEFVNHLRNLSVDERQTVLETLVIGKRKMGPVLASRILEWFGFEKK